MTTARARMVELSGLSGAHSARAHFLAIAHGTGKTVFASQFSVVAEAQESAICERPKRINVAPVRKRSARVEPLPPTQFAVGAQKEATFVFVPKEVIHVTLQTECLYVMRRSASSVITKQFGRSTVTEART